MLLIDDKSCFRRFFTVFVSLAIALLAASCNHIIKPTFTELSAGRTVTKFQGLKYQGLSIKNDRYAKNARHVNIYLEGDGQPWLGRHEVSDDPSPVYPLALELMMLDGNAAVYLTRPCYHGLDGQLCHPRMWTSGRYSHDVVAAMTEHLRHIISENPTATYVLVGYSGGGTLALLLAREVDAVAGVLTVAGNVDTDAWTELHMYSPLEESLNPAKLRLASGIPHVHLVGEEDKNIPPRLGRRVYGRENHSVITLPAYNHSCCWPSEWPNLLREALAQMEL